MFEVTVKELYKKIWNHPLSELSKQWNVNATALGKLCDSKGIPRPKSGHWTKVAIKNAPSPLALPKDIDSSKLVNLSAIELKPKNEQMVRPLLTMNKVAVPKTLRKPHHLTVIAKQKYHKPTFEHDKLMVGARQGETYQFAVSPEKFDRALKIFDALVKYFEKQNWTFKITDNFTRRSKINAVVIDGSTVTFRLREKTKQTLRELNTQEKVDKAAGRYVYYEKVLIPTGMFHLTIEEYVDGHCKTAFIDKPSELIEVDLNEFIASLVATSNHMKQQEIERAKKEQERHKQQELNDFFNKEVQNEKDNIAFLFDQFENWQKAEKARQFVAAIKQRIHVSGAITKDQEKWLLWAEHILTIEDPVAKAIEFSSVPKVEDELTQSIDAFAVNDYFNDCIVHRPKAVDKTALNNAIIDRMNKNVLI